MACLADAERGETEKLAVVNPGAITTTHGTVTLAADGSFTYTPQSNFAGTDLFSYQTTDGQAVSRLAVVTITITEQTIKVVGDTAIVRHALSAQTNDSGKPGTVSLKVLGIWQKQGGTWKMIARQAVRPPAP